MYIDESVPLPLALANFNLEGKAAFPTFYRSTRSDIEETMANNQHDISSSSQHDLQHQSIGDYKEYSQGHLQQQQQHIPYSTSASPSIPQQHLQAATSGNGGPSSVGTPSSDAQKANRLRKACDSCSIRKVKCDESGPPCRACASLDIPCTFERPTRRRGPPNKHAEAIKRRRMEQEQGFSASSSPPSPNNVAATLASLSSHAVLNAESICPLSTLELLIDDFFTYIHPLVPFPHEPSFRAAFKHREDLNNPPFLALLASMVGALVASFPRKPRLHLKAQSREKLFPNSISLVERCHKVAVEARGTGYLDKELTVYDAATSYFLGLAGAYTFSWKQCRLYFAEALTIARSLGVHKIKDATIYSAASTSGSDENGYIRKSPETVDYIRQEIGRRIFWITFVGVRSMQQMGAAFPELTLPPPTRHDPYPPLPLEVDDEFIYVSHIDSQPAGVVSRMVGFNLNCQIYMHCTSLNTMELAYGIDELFDWTRQKRVLEECLRLVKHTLDTAPTELLLRPEAATGEHDYDRGQYFPPAQDFPGRRAPATGSPVQTPDEQDRRYLQFEIQKANVFASQLATRSYIVEKYWTLHEAHGRRQKSGSSSGQSSPGTAASITDTLFYPTQVQPQAVDNNEITMNAERESIVKDLLRVLGSISQVNMEPNGGSFINKIRQIASTLLDTPRNRKSPLALRAEEYLGRFLDVLMKLERVSPGKSNGGEDWEDEEEELRNWADLRAFQTKFLTAGGFDG